MKVKLIQDYREIESGKAHDAGEVIDVPDEAVPHLKKLGVVGDPEDVKRNPEMPEIPGSKGKKK